MNIYWCTLWQYCRTYGFDFPTFSTITGVRGAAGGRHLAVANPPCIYIERERIPERQTGLYSLND